jgi:autonomous glycyl radical cofactor GrcA
MIAAAEDAGTASLLVVAADDEASDEEIAVVELGSVTTEEVAIEAGWQSKRTLWIATSQSLSLPCCGTCKDTDVAPPH